ncbi:MAG: tRNA-guanine transglycosylase DpdA [Candidatus Sericytochromatia bacterium]
MRYFIPDWDDLVDPHYDFQKDQHAPTREIFRGDVYAHEIYVGNPAYDGILVSRAQLEQNQKKKALAEEIGVHGTLRIPLKMPVLGDSGAFGYLMQDTPPYKTDEIVAYYEQLGFDYGVSIDHLIIPELYEQKDRRMAITLENAKDMIELYRRGSYHFKPIAAVQGWDPLSYRNCAEQIIEMGYTYIGLGGLVRSTTTDILAILRELQPLRFPKLEIHLFGIGRLDALEEMMHLGVTSIDSASPLRKAWTDASKNYFVFREGRDTHIAIRIPQASEKGAGEISQAIKQKLITLEQAQFMEQYALEMLRSYDRGEAPLQDALDAVMNYSELKNHLKVLYQARTLQSEYLYILDGLKAMSLNLFSSFAITEIEQHYEELAQTLEMPSLEHYEVTSWGRWIHHLQDAQLKEFKKRALTPNFAQEIQDVLNDPEIAKRYNRYLKAWEKLFTQLSVVRKYTSKQEGPLREVLEEQPWRHCGCTICEEIGVEVIIFRGNNRNRRRGFHNTRIFFDRLKAIRQKECVSV